MNKEPQLIDVFAMFAMLKMDWKRGSDTDNAMDCYVVAESMMKARKFFIESEGEQDEPA